MNLPEYKNLDTQHLQRLFDNMSECYKLFWFQAIVDAVADGKEIISYDDLVNDMIANAWYMVSEYKLNLGPADTLEALVHYAYKISGLKSSEKKEVIIEKLKEIKDPELKRRKQILTYNVPYRLQAPFMSDFKGDAWKGPKSDMARRINAYANLIYRFHNISGLDSTIQIDSDWAEYIRCNYEVIMGWIQYNTILYLQKRNPSVPGISNKLSPPQERKLERVKSFWKTIIEISPVRDIYGDIPLEKSNLSIDHFVPWSYVAHDELWNLHPTTKGINSSKSNHLPEWDLYFTPLCDLEYKVYELIWTSNAVHKKFDICAKEHLNNVDIKQKLYRRGLSKGEFSANLKDVIKPVYLAAQNIGFDSWRFVKHE
jgi:hypothetical protein